MLSFLLRALQWTHVHNNTHIQANLYVFACASVYLHDFFLRRSANKCYKMLFKYVFEGSSPAKGMH